MSDLPADDPPNAPLARTLPAFAPVPRKKRRAGGWTAKRQREFIEALADTGSVKSAARSVGLTPESAYYLRRQDGAEEFAAAWEAAIELGIRKIEDIAMDRAINGVQEPVFAYGELVGFKTVYNDQLLMFALRNRLPEKYAGGQAKALNGADKQMLARLKKEWRREWEREQGALQLQREVETIASINAKIDAIREKEEAAARLEEERGYGRHRDEAADEAEFEAWLEDMAPSAERQKLLPGYREEAPEEEDAGPRVRSVKDEGWD